MNLSNNLPSLVSPVASSKDSSWIFRSDPHFCQILRAQFLRFYYRHNGPFSDPILPSTSSKKKKMDTPDLGLSGLRTPRSFTKSFLSLGTLVPLSYSSPCNITPPIRTIQPTCLYRQPEKNYFFFELDPNRASQVFPFKNQFNNILVHQQKLPYQQASSFLNSADARS